MDWIAALTPIIAQIERSSYQKGWDDAVTHILEAARKPGIAPIQHDLGFLPQQEDAPVAKVLQLNMTGGVGKSTVGLVFELIKASPGLRGTAIVDAIFHGAPTGRDRKSVDRTVRTALLRLKSRGDIEARKNLWYVKEKQ